MRQPVRIGRLSSTAMAKSVRPIMSRRIFCGISNSWPETSGSSGYSTGSKPVRVVRDFSQRMTVCRRSETVTSHMPEGSLRTTSQSSLPGRTMRPSSINVAGMVVSIPSARSVQMMRRPSSQDSSRMPSRIGFGLRCARARLTVVRLAFSSFVSQEKRIFINLHGVVEVYIDQQGKR